MKQLLAILTLLSLVIQPGLIASGQENITPIESVEWIPGDEPEESIDSEEGSEDIEETTTEGLEDTDEEVTEESTEENFQADYDNSTYLSFMQSIQSAEAKAFEYVNFVAEGEAFTALSHSLVKNGDYYYITQLYPPFLPTTHLIESDRQEIQAGYYSLDDLMINAADGLNQQPQIYSETVVEEFYGFSQDNYEELEGKYVEVEVESLPLTDISLEMFQLEDFMIQVLIDWLEYDVVNESFLETELGQQVDITGEVGDLFNEIVNNYVEEYPEVTPFLEQFPQGFQGTVMFNLENGLVGLGLISEFTETYTAGTELYIEYREPNPVDLTEEAVITSEEITELFGRDVIQEIQDLEQSLTADMFVPYEGNEE